MIIAQFGKCDNATTTSVLLLLFFFVNIVVEIDNRDIHCKLLNGLIRLKHCDNKTLRHKQ